MTQKQRAQRELSARRIVGFACNQAFLFFLLYMGQPRSVNLGGFVLERADVAFTLLFMVVGFAVARTLNAAAVTRVFSRPLLYVYAILAAAGSLLSLAFPDGGTFWAAAQGALTGVPLAYLLTAWGRAFGREPTTNSVPEVFLGSLVAAFVCLLFSVAPNSEVVLVVMRMLPLAGVVNIEVPAPDEALMPTGVDAAKDEVGALSVKIVAGTALFGFAAGLLETLGGGMSGASGMPQAAASWVGAMPYHRVAMVLFGAFLIGGLSLLLSDGFGRGEALNKSYRLALFVMAVGVLLVPWPALWNSPMPGSAVVLAGYLGLAVVLVSLFIVMAKISALDCAVSFSIGFTALFAGELAGTLASCAVSAIAPDVVPYLPAVIAGAVALFGYFFLFTERDFGELAEIATVSDTFEDTCDTIIGRFGLSKREGEILAYALRGRTSERIAQELVIAKSTVDTHLRRIYAKCGVHSRQELIDLGEEVARS